MKKIIIILTVATLCGCVSYGRKIDQTKVAQIKPGSTTHDQVINLIGSPDQITSSGEVVTFTYSYLKSSPTASTYIPIVGAFAGGANVQNETVLVMFTNNVVSSLTSSYGGNDVGTGANAASSANLPTTTDDKRPK